MNKMFVVVSVVVVMLLTVVSFSYSQVIPPKYIGTFVIVGFSEDEGATVQPAEEPLTINQYYVTTSDGVSYRISDNKIVQKNGYTMLILQFSERNMIWAIVEKNNVYVIFLYTMDTVTEKMRLVCRKQN